MSNSNWPSILNLFLNNGITDPLDPNTFPKRTATNSVLISYQMIEQSFHIIFEAPIILVGLTALSVEIKINFLTPY